MASLMGSGVGRLVNDDGSPLPFELALIVEIGVSDEVEIREFTIRSIDGVSEVTPQVISEAIPTIPTLAIFLANRVLSENRGNDRPKVDSVVEQKLAELVISVSRRNGTAAVEELEVAAEAYLQAQQFGQSAREAVMNAMHVRKSRADQLIAEARKQGLIGPAVIGRPRGSKNRVKQPSANADVLECS